jgi:hypothetical protein
MVVSGTTPEQRDDHGADREDRADRRDAVSVHRDERADERDVASDRRDHDARDRIGHLAGRIHEARAQLSEHLRRIEATEHDPERRRMLALERATIAGLLDEVLDELLRSRQMRQATGRDRTDAATDRHASADDRSPPPTTGSPRSKIVSSPRSNARPPIPWREIDVPGQRDQATVPCMIVCVFAVARET